MKAGKLLDIVILLFCLSLFLYGTYLKTSDPALFAYNSESEINNVKPDIVCSYNYEGDGVEVKYKGDTCYLENIPDEAYLKHDNRFLYESLCNPYITFLLILILLRNLFTRKGRKEFKESWRKKGDKIRKNK